MCVNEADWQGCSHVLQYAFRDDSGERCWLTPSIESGVPGPDATRKKAAHESQKNYFILFNSILPYTKKYLENVKIYFIYRN